MGNYFVIYWAYRVLVFFSIAYLTGVMGTVEKRYNVITSTNRFPVSDSSSLEEIDLTKKVIFNSTDKVIIGKIASFGVDDKNRVFIADMDRTTIHVLNPDGTYLKSIGRQGKGPAEFSAITRNTNIVIDSKHIYIPDYANASSFFPNRAQVYDVKNLKFSHTIKLIADNRDSYQLEGYYPSKLYSLNDSMIVAYRRRPYEYKDRLSFIRYVIQDSSGQIKRQPILEQKDVTNLTYVVKNVPTPYLAVSTFRFLEKPLFALLNHKIYAAQSREFKIVIYDLEGEKIKSFEPHFINRELTTSKLIERYRNKEKSVLGQGVAENMIKEAADDLPETWPALDAIFVDDESRLWVATIVSDLEFNEWWILSENGNVISKFRWPRDKSIKTVKNDYLYTQEKDENGVSIVVKYKIDFRKK